MKKLLSFTLLLAAITMTGGCLNQDKEEGKDAEIVQTEKATRYGSIYPSMYVNAVYAGVGGQMTLIANNTWQKTGVISYYTGLINFDVYNDGSLYFGDSNKDGIVEQGTKIALVSLNKPYTVTFNELTKKYTITEETKYSFIMFNPENQSDTIGNDMNNMILEVYDSNNIKYLQDKISIRAKFGCPGIINNIKYGGNTLKLNGLKYQRGEKYAKRYVVNSICNVPLSELTNVTPMFSYFPVTITKEYFTSNYSQMYIRGTFNDWQNTIVDDYGKTVPSKMGLIANNVWCAEITTTAAGSFKFDRDGDWGYYNYGDNNSDGIADRNSSNINIPSAGVWKVTFNENTLRYTLEKLN